jgi:hypothetical protein
VRNNRQACSSPFFGESVTEKDFRRIANLVFAMTDPPLVESLCRGYGVISEVHSTDLLDSISTIKFFIKTFYY